MQTVDRRMRSLLFFLNLNLWINVVLRRTCGETAVRVNGGNISGGCIACGYQVANASCVQG